MAQRPPRREEPRRNRCLASCVDGTRWARFPEISWKKCRRPSACPMGRLSPPPQGAATHGRPNTTGSGPGRPRRRRQKLAGPWARVVWPPARGARWTTQAPAPWAGVGGRDMMGMMLIWPVLLLVLGALLVAGVVWAVQLSSRGGSPSAGMRSAGEAPSEILRRRFAGGEITKEQFDEMRRTLDQIGRASCRERV